jgi:hypothetical protein
LIISKYLRLSFFCHEKETVFLPAAAPPAPAPAPPAKKNKKNIVFA